MDFEETELWKRAVPYVIWCNYACEGHKNTPFCSMTDLIPMILSYINMPLTPYYSQILTIREAIPVRTRFGILMDREGNIYAYDESDNQSKQLTQYYYMEYNGITAMDDYLPELFQISFPYDSKNGTLQKKGVIYGEAP